MHTLYSARNCGEVIDVKNSTGTSSKLEWALVPKRATAGEAMVVSAGNSGNL